MAVGGQTSSPQSVKDRLLGAVGARSSKRRSSNIQLDVTDKEERTVSTLGFEPQLSSYIVEIARRDLIPVRVCCPRIGSTNFDPPFANIA